MADEKKPIEILFNDESLSDLSEDFKTKATVIFETAVASEVRGVKETLAEEYKVKLDEKTQEIEKDLEQKVDSYLTYVAEEWLKENELAVENGIQVEIAENFFKGMKEVFVDSYVEVPESKVDLVAEMTKDLKEKGTALDESIDKNIELKKEILEMKRSQIVSKYTVDMADTQVAKLNDLVEMVDFEDETQFSDRIESIVETYFKGKIDEKENPFEKKDKKDDDEEDEDDDDKKKDDKKKDDKEDKKSTDESMDRYIVALKESMKS